MVGSDANVDLLQLALRITGTTEVSTILALFPHWDSAPRRLKLPVLSENDIEVEQKQDHITPLSWTGNVAVKNVNLRTSWILGRKDIEVEFPALAPVLKELSDKRAAGESIDILQSFGKDIVHAEHAADNIDDSAEDYQEAGAVPSASNSDLDPPPEPFTEDAVAEDDPEQKHSPTFTLERMEVYKGRWLNQLFCDYKNPQAGSQDRLKCVANLPRYMVQTDATYSSVIRSDEDPTGTQITLDIPIVTFIECEDKFFVCIGEVTDIVHNNEYHTSLSVELLGEPSASITFQLLHIRAEARHTRLPGTLQSSSTLTSMSRKDILVIGAMIFGRIPAADGPKIASIPRSAHFPYQNFAGKLCFLCEDETIEHEIARIGCCAHCSPPVKLSSRIPDILNHNAAHILLTLQSKQKISPVVSAFALLPNAHLFSKVDGRKANCPGYSRFSYQTASISETKNPSSNVPVLCPISSCSAVVWKYVLPRHFKECHPGLPQSVYNTHAISATEKMLLKHLWSNRHAKTQRKSKKSKQKKSIERDASDRYKTSWALRINDDEEVGAVPLGEINCDGREIHASVPDLSESDDQEDLPLHLALPKSRQSSSAVEDDEDITMDKEVCTFILSGPKSRRKPNGSRPTSSGDQ
ncbi:hypothetical protein B0H14DRAFT_2557327 [Mycena olivaceomarginata]|nr:hypothetical protein B0H14DRAFT_2557327 [Mycena olivaceomarginata]